MTTPGVLVKLRQLEQLGLITKKAGTERTVRYAVNKPAIARLWANFIEETELDENLRKFRHLNTGAEAENVDKAIRKKCTNLKNDECFFEFAGMYAEALAEVKYSSALTDAFELFSAEILPALFIERGSSYVPAKRAAEIRKNVPFAWQLEIKKRVLVSRVVDSLSIKITKANMPRSAFSFAMPLDYGKPTISSTIMKKT